MIKDKRAKRFCLRKRMLQLDNNQEVQKQLASSIGKTLRDYFGRGPETVYVSIRNPFITVYIRNFISPTENVLLSSRNEELVQNTRDIIMKKLIPEIKAYITVLTNMEIEEFYYDWGLHNKSGMFVAISKDKTSLERLSQEAFTNKDALHEEINNIGQQTEKVPEEVLSVKLNDRTIAVLRTGLLITIERELIRLGHRETLRAAKRNIEKRHLHNSMQLETILDSKIDDVFVSWDFDRDKSIILFIVNPNQSGGNVLDK
jgi:uncharacterized protein YbcI